MEKNGNRVSICRPLTGKIHIRRHQTCEGAKDATQQKCPSWWAIDKLSKENYKVLFHSITQLKPQLSTKLEAFITDGEQALSQIHVWHEAFPKGAQLLCMTPIKRNLTHTILKKLKFNPNDCVNKFTPLDYPTPFLHISPPQSQIQPPSSYTPTFMYFLFCF